MLRDRRMERSDAEVVPLAGRLRQRSRPAQDLPAARNLHFEELLCRAVAARLLVELRYDAEVEPRLFAPHLVYRSTTGRINVGGTQIHNPGQPEDSYEAAPVRSRADPHPAPDRHKLPPRQPLPPRRAAVPRGRDLRPVSLDRVQLIQLPPSTLSVCATM